jgi:hypothetical protein
MLSEAQVLGLSKVCSKAMSVVELLDESCRREGVTDEELDAVRAHVGRLKAGFCRVLRGPVTKPIVFYS